MNHFLAHTKVESVKSVLHRKMVIVHVVVMTKNAWGHHKIALVSSISLVDYCLDIWPWIYMLTYGGLKVIWKYYLSCVSSVNMNALVDKCLDKDTCVPETCQIPNTIE